MIRLDDYFEFLSKVKQRELELELRFWDESINYWELTSKGKVNPEIRERCLDLAKMGRVFVADELLRRSPKAENRDDQVSRRFQDDQDRELHNG